jgi:hypothetical protein
MNIEILILMSFALTGLVLWLLVNARNNYIKQNPEDPFDAVLRLLKPRMVYDIEFAKDVYAAITNTWWIHYNLEGIEDDQLCLSFREAGGFVADIRDQGENCMDFYCSKPEGTVTPIILWAFESCGWKIENERWNINNDITEIKAEDLEETIIKMKDIKDNENI